MNVLTAIWAWLSSGVGLWSSSGIAVLLISFLLKKYVKTSMWVKFGKLVYSICFIPFDKLSRFLNKITIGFWNKIIEPVFKIFLTTLLKNVLNGAIDGLDSDNKGKNE